MRELSVLSGLVLAMITAACQPEPQAVRRTGEGDSVLASIKGVDKELQQKQDLTYDLLCAPSSTDELSKVATVTVPAEDDDAPDTSISFEPLAGKTIAIGDWCALDVKSDENHDDFVFKTGTKGLFYASTKTEVGAGRKLEVTIYQVFLDKSDHEVTMTVATTFPEKTEGEWQMTIHCKKGDEDFKSWKSEKNAKIGDELTMDVTFKIPYTQLETKDVKCDRITAGAVIEDQTPKDSLEGTAANAKLIDPDDADTLKASVTLANIPTDSAEIQANIKVNECIDFDLDTRTCKDKKEDED